MANAFDPTAEQPDYKSSLLKALAGGTAAPQVDPTKAELPPVGGAPAAAPAQSWSPGAKAGQDVTLLGFDSKKLFDPSSGSAAGSKYTNDAKVFANGLKQDVGVSRGGLGNMANYYHDNGYPNATVVGDDKIDPDGPGPMAPIDVIRGDGQIVYQNTTGNPQWEQQYGGGASTGGAPQAGGLSSMLGGDAGGNIQQALSGLQSSNLLQQLIAQLQGGR